MSKTDPIADSFTIIRNAVSARKEEVMLPYSKVLNSVCAILKNEGYIENFTQADLGTFHKLKVYLRYSGKKNAISQLKRVSKPGNRVYVTRAAIRPVLNGYGVGFISTSKGVMTDLEARQKGLGGEFIGIVW